jgi:hypothetical protein
MIGRFHMATTRSLNVSAHSMSLGELVLPFGHVLGTTWAGGIALVASVKKLETGY